MTAFASLLGNPQLSFPIIHVAGTNGKGSVCSMLDAIYRANGYRVGLFTSPHLVELGERIRVDGTNLSMSEIADFVNELRPVAKRMDSEKPGFHPTFFEFMTAMAFLKFREAGVDLAVIETGLGGRLDSTNVVDPELSLITTIAKDHCSILGNEIELIAEEKAGIVKTGKPVLTGWLESAANQVVERIAQGRGAPFETLAHLSPSSAELPETNLLGEYQRRNAALAKRAVEILSDRFPIDGKKVESGLRQVSLQGRWQVLPGKPMIILDACHNEEGAEALTSNLHALGKTVEVWFGSLGEDRAKEVLHALLPFSCSFKFFRPNQPRACSPQTLVEMLPDTFDGPISTGKTDRIEEYLERADKDRIILMTGSIYLLGEILSSVKNLKKNQGSEFQDLV
jgi:dihydrofolate synthase/folylpolyglutamate synthase